jgi:hypothetical protein
VIAARLLRPLDNDRAVVFVESATPHLALLSRVGAKLRVLAEVDAPGETAMLQTLPDQRVAAIGRDGSTTTWRCIESGFTHVLSVPSTLSADLALLVSIPQGGTAHLEGDDTIVFDTGGRTKTKRKRPRLSAISERQHVALGAPSNGGYQETLNCLQSLPVNRATSSVFGTQSRRSSPPVSAMPRSSSTSRRRYSCVI